MTVNVSDSSQDGQTPLHCAASRDHAKVAALLLTHGANPDIVDEVPPRPCAHEHDAFRRGAAPRTRQRRVAVWTWFGCCCRPAPAATTQTLFVHC